MTITKPSLHVSSQSVAFERSYEMPSSTYHDYQFSWYEVKVKKEWSLAYLYNQVVKDINQTWFTLQDLEDGSYTFDVIMHYTFNGNARTGGDSKIFTMWAAETPRIEIQKPTWAPITWLNVTEKEVEFKWDWWATQFSKYHYRILKGGQELTSWDVTSNTELSRQFKYNLWSGNYKFEVEMYNGSDVLLTWVSRDFSVNISSTAWAYLSIQSPSNRAYYTWNNETTVQLSFWWNGWWTSLISKYNYSLVNTVTGNPVTGWTVNGSVNSIPDISLPSGRYRFDVTMLFSDNSPIIPTVSHTFNVVIPSHLNIITPSQNASFSGQQNINFSWSWFAEFANNYHYEWSLKKKTKDGTVTSETWSTSSMTNMWVESFQRTLSNGLYDFTVRMMDGNTEVLSKSSSFTILDSIDLQVYVSDWNSSVTTLKSGTGTFVWNWESEDFSKYVYTIFGLSSGSTFAYSWELFSKTWSVTLNNLSSWRYRFEVTMLRSDNSVITWRYVDFDVEKPAWIKIISPLSWATITSSSATFQWSWYSDVVSRYQYTLLKSGESVDAIYVTTGNSFVRSNLANGNYILTVWLYSWDSLVASDAISFIVSIPSGWWWGWGGWWWGWGGWWWSSVRSSSTSSLSVSVLNKEPYTSERIGIEINEDKKYTWKVDFTKIQYNSNWNWVDFSLTSNKYVSAYSDEAWLWYVRFSSSDDWKIKISKFIKLIKSGKYRIYVEDKDWHSDYVQFQVWDSDEEEVYISRSCKRYIIRYNSDLWVYTSPNLLKNEYFVSKDYFKRYVDSKNNRIDGCPTNVWWISTRYYDDSNSSDKYIAPNGKVYFIVWKWWNYYSDELNKELKTPTGFSTISELKNYIASRNPLIPIINTKVWNNMNVGAFVSSWKSEGIPVQNLITLSDNSNSWNGTNGYNSEYNSAYQFAYKNWITTMWSIEGANMNWNLTRIAMAKMLSNYAVNVLWKRKVSDNVPVFSDVSWKLNNDYWWAVTLAYQLWIMWQNMPDNRFRPYDIVTRAEFATALSRMLYGTTDWQYKSTDRYYTNHLNKLMSEGIITRNDPRMHELRWYVMIMLMRSAKN